MLYNGIGAARWRWGDVRRHDEAAAGAAGAGKEVAVRLNGGHQVRTTTTVPGCKSLSSLEQRGATPPLVRDKSALSLLDLTWD